MVGLCVNICMVDFEIIPCTRADQEMHLINMHCIYNMYLIYTHVYAETSYTQQILLLSAPSLGVLAEEQNQQH